MSRKRFISVCLSVCMLFSMILPQTAVKAENATDEGTPEDAVIIDASDYEPDTEHGNDWAEAIQQMIEDAKESDGPVVLNFPKGEYHIYPDHAYERELYVSNTLSFQNGNPVEQQQYKNKKIGFLFEDMENITVEGNGSMFMFHGKMTSFSTIRSNNIKFHNLSFDFYVPTVIDITVESIDNSTKTAVVSVPMCYNYEVNNNTVTWKSDESPYTGQIYWSGRNSYGNYTQYHDFKTNLTYRGGSNPVFTNTITKVTDLGNHKIEFTYSSLHGDLKEGLCCQMRTTVRDHPGMFFWRSQNITLEEINAHFLHGFGIVGQHSENLTLRNVIFEAPKNTMRTTVGYADFVQMSGCKGQVLIEGCSFANPHDDPINVHGTFNQVVERISDTQFKVRYMHHETSGFPNYFVGDKVEFMTSGNMITVPDSVATVTAVEGPSGTDSTSPTGSLRDIIITLDKAMPADITANGYVVENITWTPSVTIQNNIFKETPTRGVLTTTRQPVVIKNNVFDGMGMASIYISNDAQGWYESGPVRDVTIEGNTFLRPVANAAAILIEPTNPTVSTTATVHENIKIRNNTFYMQNGQVLNAKSVKGLSFAGNHIYRYEPVTLTLDAVSTHLRQGKSTQLSANASWKKFSSQLYSFNGCKDVTIEGNSYDGGLNLRASTSNMTAEEELTIGAEEDVVLGSNNILPENSAETQYEISDESVLKINDDKTVTGINAGTATIRAYVEIGSEKYYSDEVKITVEQPSSPENNAYLAKAEFGNGLDSDISFDSEILTYSAVSESDTVSLKLETEDDNASIKVLRNNTEISSGTGSLDASIALNEENDNTKVYVIVTSSNGKNSRIYEFDIGMAQTSYTWLSDIEWTSASNGWAGHDVQKDLSVGSKTLTLLNANNEEQTFEKGLGAHANCTIIYNLENSSYSTFSSWLGIDREEKSSQYGSVIVRIYGDDKLLAETETLLNGSPMKFISVPVAGVKELKLVGDIADNDYSDHIDFADAKLKNKDTFTVRYQASSNGRGSVSAVSGQTTTTNGIIAAAKTESVTLKAASVNEADYTFMGWYDEAGNRLSENSEYTISNIRRDFNCTAKFQPVNLSALQDAIDQAVTDLDGYTSSSAAAYSAALQAAKVLLENADTASKEDIANAVSQLNTAKMGLATVRETIQAAIDKAGDFNVNAGGYTAESINAYNAALQELKNLLTQDNVSEDEMIQAIAKLENAKKGLKQKGNTGALKTAIDEAKNLDLSGYSAESAAAYRTALEEAEKLLANEANVLQADIDAALKKLSEAKNGLKPLSDPTPALPQLNETFDSGIFRYKVTKSDASSGTVMLTAVIGKAKKKTVIPAAVTKNNVSFKVTAIDKKVFQKNTRISAITIGANITKIDKDAFKNCKKLKTIIFNGKKTPKITGKAFKGSGINTVATPKMAKKQINLLKSRLKKAGVKGSPKYKKK